MLLLLMPDKMTGAASPEIGVVGVDRLNMRQGRGIDHPLVKVLKKDDQVQVISRSDGWIKVQHEGDVGYVSDRKSFINLRPDIGAGSRKTPKLDAAAAKATDILRKIKQQASEVSAFNRQEKEIINRLDKTDRALSEARRKAAAMESEMKKLSHQISEMKNQVGVVQKAIDAKSGYAVKRLVALYKVDRLGEANLLASATTLNDLLHRKSALEKILNHDSRVVADLAAEKKRLSGLMNESAQKIEKQESLKKDYQKTIAELSGEKAERERLLSEIKDKKINRLATIKYLKAAAREMDQTIDALRQEQIREQKKAEARALKEAREVREVREVREAQMAAQKEAPDKARETTGKCQEKNSADDRIKSPSKTRDKKPAPAAHAEKKAVRRAATKNMDNNDFSAHQGLLKMPVSGSIVSKFGKYIEPHSGAVNFRNGIEIKTQQGTPIRAVFSGQTIFSSWLKGYGNVIIIAHGEHFHTVYAHVQEVFSAKGKPVEAGEVIATVGDSGSMSGPSLYFEIRHQGSPVDPLKWVNKS
ncbi:MAG: peptidoglycan DD-metalloendopeptidase family protein [Desulfosalsimonadaceae bacterium]|nr:peptidoglycan DD-metalloendopeptidase family protein [Desulfosalsimonadaceae bacterium]